MPSYDLSLLTEFNTGLVYGFQPEGSSSDSDSTSLKNTCYHLMGQHIDVFNAYYFAQQILLPKLKLGLDQVTPADIVQWLKAIHKFMGNTLLKELNIPAGEFSNTPMYHWEAGGALSDMLSAFFSGNDWDNRAGAFAKQCAAMFPVNERELLKFITILVDMADSFHLPRDCPATYPLLLIQLQKNIMTIIFQSHKKEILIKLYVFVCHATGYRMQ